MTHYETLGVDRNASIKEIAAAMRQLRKEHHPDREGGNTERMSAINAAYDVLSDPTKRKAYDDQQPDTDRDALALLESIFKAALTNDAADVVVFTRIKLNEVRTQANQVDANARNTTKKLIKRRARVKVKAGTNLVHALIDKQLEVLAGQQAGCADTLLVVERAFVLIGDYVDEPEAERHFTASEMLARQQEAALRLQGFNRYMLGSGL